MTTATVAMEQQSLSNDITKHYLEYCFDVLDFSEKEPESLMDWDCIINFWRGLLNGTEIGDLESIITTELEKGLSSDTENSWF